MLFALDPYSYHFSRGTQVQVCGEGEGVRGDAVVPVTCALLEGADTIEVPGIFHSMSRVGTFQEPGSTLTFQDLAYQTCYSATICLLCEARGTVSYSAVPMYRRLNLSVLCRVPVVWLGSSRRHMACST